MPKVGGKHFSYTKKGKQRAKEYAKRLRSESRYEVVLNNIKVNLISEQAPESGTQAFKRHFQSPGERRKRSTQAFARMMTTQQRGREVSAPGFKRGTATQAFGRQYGKKYGEG